MNKRIVSVCALGLLSVYGIAQQKDKKVEQLDEVVVSDSRFELKRENSGKTVIKIDREEIEKNQGKTVSELINVKAGIEVNGSRSNAGQDLNTYVRGGSNRQVLVLIDGVQVSDPSQISNGYDLRLLSLGAIESIEIIKGAASTLYGSGAATVVINITTKEGEEGAIALSLNSSIGTNQTKDDQNYNPADFHNDVTINGKGGDFNYLLSFNQQYTDGMSAADTEADVKDPFSRYAIKAKFGYDFCDAFSLGIYGDYTDIESAYDGGANLDADNWYNSKQYRTGLTSRISYTGGAVIINGAYSKYDREFISAFPSDFKSENMVVDAYSKNTFADVLHTIVGVNVVNDKTEFDSNESVTRVDPYLNMVVASDRGYNINTGGRLNVHSEYGTHFTYNVNPSFTAKFDQNYIKFFGSYSTSFIAPSLSQLFGFYGPNPDLKPEEDKTIEGGIEFKYGQQFRVSALYFNREEKNLIGYDFNQGYYNVTDKTTAQGVEVELVASPVEVLSITANYAFTERKDDVPFKIPKHKANVSIGYDFTPRSYVSLSYQYNADRLDSYFNPDTSQSSAVTLEAFSLFNAYVNHQLSEKVKVFAGVDNILNEGYTEIFGYNTKGRNVRLGFSITL
ncbi:TonB-dependent receptor [Zhouia spongiae]|uniref:TonB-dependent receptor n=1 Tax=Zhouia spongiae TaxID=2202721 RepID=A0ABY3YIK4_9FLAO|nr:TonB-dependent receptor [Zhouia spongiae]UNY97680.1 TonB-dependent receptor [Zhouia spongiae]